MEAKAFRRRGHDFSADRLIKKLAPGLATIVSYKDGSVDILEMEMTE